MTKTFPAPATFLPGIIVLHVSPCPELQEQSRIWHFKRPAANRNKGALPSSRPTPTPTDSQPAFSILGRKSLALADGIQFRGSACYRGTCLDFILSSAKITSPLRSCRSSPFSHGPLRLPGVKIFTIVPPYLPGICSETLGG